MKELLLVGAGGHCQSCIEVVESTRQWNIVGLVGRPDEVGRSVLGYPVIGTDAELSQLLSPSRSAFVAIGQIKSCEARELAFQKLQSLGTEMPSIVASSAVVSQHASLGKGTVVMHGAIINAGAKIGNNCIINSGAIIEHGASVGDHCHISTRSVLNGEVRVGDRSFVGSGAIVYQQRKIGNRAIVGAAAVIARDVSDGEIVQAGQSDWEATRP